LQIGTIYSPNKVIGQPTFNFVVQLSDSNEQLTSSDCIELSMQAGRRQSMLTLCYF